MSIAAGIAREQERHSNSQLPPNDADSRTMVIPLFGTITVSFIGGFFSFLELK